jgi:signal transduction histidine kinase
VADTGIGIPPAAISQVFDRFFRVDEARSREDGGAGLGLAIVKSICLAHGAEIEVQSRLGDGSCFRVTFPRRARASATDASAAVHCELHRACESVLGAEVLSGGLRLP